MANLYLKQIITYAVVIILFPAMLYAYTGETKVLSDGEKLGVITYKNEGFGRTYFKDKLIIEGIKTKDFDGKNVTVPLQVVSVVELSQGYVLNLYSDTENATTSKGWYIKKSDGSMTDYYDALYEDSKYIIETSDKRFALLKQNLEDGGQDEFNLTFLDELTGYQYGNYSDNGIMKNIAFSGPYSITFTDNRGKVTENLLEWFSVCEKTPSIDVCLLKDEHKVSFVGKVFTRFGNFFKELFSW